MWYRFLKHVGIQHCTLRVCEGKLEINSNGVIKHIDLAEIPSGCRKMIEVNPDSFCRCVPVTEQAAESLSSDPLDFKYNEVLPFLETCIWIPGVRLSDLASLRREISLSKCYDKKLSCSLESKPKFRFVDLFAGIGGFRLGLEALGGKCVFASEIDEWARKTYCANFHDVPRGDLRQVEASSVPPHDILVGGFPCQSFSSLGQQRGLLDSRGALFFHLVRILAHCRPAAFLLENVRGLATMDGGATLRRVVAELEALGYVVSVRLFNSQLLLPQFRERVFLAGLLPRPGPDLSDAHTHSHRSRPDPNAITMQPFTSTLQTHFHAEVTDGLRNTPLVDPVSAPATLADPVLDVAAMRPLSGLLYDSPAGTYVKCVKCASLAPFSCAAAAANGQIDRQTELHPEPLRTVRPRAGPCSFHLLIEGIDAHTLTDGAGRQAPMEAKDAKEGGKLPTTDLSARILCACARERAPCPRVRWPRFEQLRACVEVGHNVTGNTGLASVSCVLEPRHRVPARCYLSERKWNKVAASSYFAKHPQARLCGPSAIAQTLHAGYRRGYLLYSQFFDERSRDSPDYPDSSPGELADLRLAEDVGQADQRGPQALVRVCGPLASTQLPRLDDNDHDNEKLHHHNHNNNKPRPRFWTVRECARLQGFPESFLLNFPGANEGRLYSQLGNAVSPPLVVALAGAVLESAGVLPDGLRLGCDLAGQFVRRARENSETKFDAQD